MKRSRLRRPSPALVLAFIALTIAMAGSAVAASGVLVTSSKQIKAHSIALSDLSKSTVKKLRGKRGLRGLTGATGAQGAAGATGATGPSDVYSSSLAGFVTMTATGLGTQVTLRTLNLPAGKFLINAYVLLNNNDASRRTWNCQLAAGGDTFNYGADVETTGADGADDRTPLALRVTHEFTAPGTATLSCAWSGTAGAAACPVVRGGGGAPAPVTAGLPQRFLTLTLVLSVPVV